MSIYKSPIQPYDPVVRMSGTSAFQYIRDNFYGAGQDSYTRPFGQNQELFQALKNVMPVAQGALRLRYGYSLFNNPGFTVQRFGSYQNVGSNLRRLLLIGGTNISWCNEDGTSVTNITTSTNSNPRFVNSRDYAFFPNITNTTTWPSGQQSDGKKWHSVNGLSDWGLAEPSTSPAITSTGTAGNITLASGRVYAGAWRNSTTGHYSDLSIGGGSFQTGSAGPTLPGTGSSVAINGSVVWSTPGSITATDGVSAVAALNANISQQLQATNFGFAIPVSGTTITGIQVTIKKAVAPLLGDFVTDANLVLLKGGVAVGTDKGDDSTLWPTTLTNVSYGGPTDLWGTTWTPADINSVNFGVGFNAQEINGVRTVNCFVDSITVTVNYATSASQGTGAITSKQVSLTLPTNAPSGADKFVLLATLDGGDTETFYVLDDSITAGTSTYTDNIPDSVLVTRNRATEIDDFGIEHGLVNNQMPPVGLQFPTKHKGRIYGAIKEDLWFSKNLDEITTSTGLVLGRYEEAWPATNTLPVSTEEETVRGLLSDGNTLYIGTERHIWRLEGDSPINFAKPEVIYNEVGLQGQDVWQVVYVEGAPTGMIWLTPDNRVIHSNFATYTDIGTPIQDVLNSRNLSATNGPWGQFFSQQGFDVYILAIPTNANNTPDTLCVYDMRAQRWLIWQLADSVITGLYNINANGAPQWLISASTGKTYTLTPTVTVDRSGDTPIPITAQLTTPWMHFGSPTMVKALNEIEIVTGDSGMLLTVNGASTQSLTSSPNNVVTSAPLTLSPRGFYKVYLASAVSKDRHYQFTFTSSGGVADVLMGYTVEVVPIPY